VSEIFKVSYKYKYNYKWEVFLTTSYFEGRNKNIKYVFKLLIKKFFEYILERQFIKFYYFEVNGIDLYFILV
jgi:hypothetical protein